MAHEEITTHDETPNDKNTNDMNSGGLARESLTESGNDDDHKLNTV
jgi:hypothetical protein